MNSEIRNVDPLEVLKSINYVDSALFGLSVDIFKIRILISARLSPSLLKFGFQEDNSTLCFDFRQIRNLYFNIRKSVFCPAYLHNGDLAAVHLLDFNFEHIKIAKVGVTGETDRIDLYQKLRDICEVRITPEQATLQFQFVSSEISIFDPLDFDRRCGITAS